MLKERLEEEIAVFVIVHPPCDACDGMSDAVGLHNMRLIVALLSIPPKVKVREVKDTKKQHTQKNLPDPAPEFEIFLIAVFCPREAN